MDNKKLEKVLTRLVERFTSVVVAYENKLATENQLHKSACDSVAKLLTLKEVESLKVDHLIDGFTKLLSTQPENLDSSIHSVCSDLYTMINEVKE